jgi:hypothetical protein
LPIFAICSVLARLPVLSGSPIFFVLPWSACDN